MTQTTTPAFGTSEDGLVKINEGKFTDTIYKYKNVTIEDGVLKYDADIQKLYVDSEDKTTSLSEYDEAAFLNTVATPILTKVLEDISKLNEAQASAESTEAE